METGTAVVYVKADGTQVAAIVLGVAGGIDQGEALYPPVHLAYIHQNRVDLLQTASWRDAIDRKLTIHHASDTRGGASFYITAEEFESEKSLGKPAPEPSDPAPTKVHTLTAADLEPKKKAKAPKSTTPEEVKPEVQPVA